MFKKILTLTLAALLAVAPLSACSQSGSQTNGSSATTQAKPSAPAYDFGALFDENGLLKTIDPSALLTLPDYLGNIPEKYLASPDEEVQKQIKSLLADYGSTQKLYEGKIKDGDTVNIDYVGKIDGVAFAGGSTQGAGTDVTIGVTQYIDDFLEQLIGHSPKEEFDIEVTFPDNYGNAELNGKDAIFSIKINYIHGEPILPELSDEIAKDYGFDTKEELIADITEWALSRQRREYFSELCEQTVVSSIPEELVTLFKQMDTEQIESTAAAYGMTADSYLSLAYGMTLEQYLSKNAEYYNDCAKQILVSQAIAKERSIVATDDDVEYIGAADYLGITDKRFLKAHALLNRTLPNYIFANAQNAPSVSS